MMAAAILDFEKLFFLYYLTSYRQNWWTGCDFDSDEYVAYFNKQKFWKLFEMFAKIRSLPHLPQFERIMHDKSSHLMQLMQSFAWTFHISA